MFELRCLNHDENLRSFQEPDWSRFMKSIVSCERSMKSQLILGVAGLLLLLTLTAGAHAWRSGAPSRALAHATATEAMAAATPQTQIISPPPYQSPLQVELITVGPTGFWPKQIVRPSGPFILLIENRSGMNLITLQMDYVSTINAPPIMAFQTQLPKTQLDW